MNIRPLYDRIVVKRIDEKETTRSGIIIPDSAQEKPQQGEVMAIGHGKRLEDGTLVALDVKIGDRVLFGKYSGTETKVVGTERSEEHTSELQSLRHLVCRLLLEKKKTNSS